MFKSVYCGKQPPIQRWSYADIFRMGRKSSWTEEQLREAVSLSVSFAGVLRHLGLEPGGGTQANIASRIRAMEIDHSHFTGQAHLKGKSPSNKLAPEEVLRVLPEGSNRLEARRLRKALQELGVEQVCNQCGLGQEWRGKFIQLEINHIDGNWLNCLQENLELLCPNCHSQDNYSSSSRSEK